MDHSCINLSLTYRANDAHLKCSGLLSLFYLLSFFSCVGLLVPSLAPTHLTFLLVYSLSFPLSLPPFDMPPSSFTMQHYHYSLLLSFFPFVFPRSPRVPGPPDRRLLLCSAGSQAWSIHTRRTTTTEKSLTEQTKETKEGRFTKTLIFEAEGG